MKALPRLRDSAAWASESQDSLGSGRVLPYGTLLSPPRLMPRGPARRDKETSQGLKQKEKLAWYCFWETVSIYRLLCGSG